MTCCTACLYLQNPDDARFCIKCGKPILLKERYFPLYPIGRGGFGRTFLAIDKHIPSQPKCVIKQLYFSDTNEANFKKAVELFHQEALRLDELQHPQIPQLLAHFEQDNQLYLVQELIVGQTLAQELQAQGVFTEVHIWQLLKDLLPVLQFIHAQQVIHRDIKPANIMRRYTSVTGNEFEDPPAITNATLLHKGSTMTIGGLEAFSPQPKQSKTFANNQIKAANFTSNSALGELVLIDFGVAKQITATALVNTGTTVGSAEYMAPEQMRGKALPASDLYSLGVTCIYLLTGISPFDLFDVTSDRWVWQNYLPAENIVSEHLCTVLDKLLQNALPQRYQSATEVLAAINAESESQLPQHPINTLYSAAGVDYKRLNDLLKAKKWHKADQETWEVMRQALSQPGKKYLFNSDLENLPCEDLQIIDQLWIKYSQGRFGFSVQLQIYENCGRDYGKFCADVGWDITKSSSAHQNLFFSWFIPKGNLPSHPWVGGTQPWRHINALGAALLKTRYPEQQ